MADGQWESKSHPQARGKRGDGVSEGNGALIRRKTFSGSHLQIGIEFQPWDSLPRPSASCPVWIRSAPFGAPDSRHSIPTTLAHPSRPGTAPDPHRSVTVDNNVIYGDATVGLRRSNGDAP